MKYRILNKKGAFKAILIHGLFTTSGYWLDYLSHFKNCKLIILDVDYDRFLNFKEHITAIEKIVDNVFAGQVDFIFSHSLGTILANGISDTKFRFSFEICPVHSSKRVAQNDFVENILTMTNNLYNPDFVNQKLSEVDVVIKNSYTNIKPSCKRIVFYPTNDLHFEYDFNTAYIVRVFEGDHFKIDNALQDSFTLINLHNWQYK